VDRADGVGVRRSGRAHEGSGHTPIVLRFCLIPRVMDVEKVLIREVSCVLMLLSDRLGRGVVIAAASRHARCARVYFAESRHMLESCVARKSRSQSSHG